MSFYHGTALDIYNALRKGNLSFSGKRGSNVEVFLDRSALFLVDNDDLIRCLSFFLSGTALYYSEIDERSSDTERIS